MDTDIIRKIEFINTMKMAKIQHPELLAKHIKQVKKVAENFRRFANKTPGSRVAKYCNSQADEIDKALIVS